MKYIIFILMTLITLCSCYDGFTVSDFFKHMEEGEIIKFQNELCVIQSWDKETQMVTLLLPEGHEISVQSRKIYNNSPSEFYRIGSGVSYFSPESYNDAMLEEKE